MSHLTLRASALSLATFLAASTSALAADPIADIEAQYQSVLEALKNPITTGILVTEVGPESAAGAGGMRAGDIILEYYNTKTTTLAALREQVADAVAVHLNDENAGKRVLARVRRGTQEQILQLPREPMGIRAIEVEAGVPGPRNPPPNQRGTLQLDWNQTLSTLAADRNAGGAAFRSFERSDPPSPATAPFERPQENWIGWQICTLIPEGASAVSGTIDLYRIEPTKTPTSPTDVPAERSTFTFHLRLGDYKTDYAFIMDQAGARYTAPSGLENSKIVANCKRLGERLQTTAGIAQDDGQPDMTSTHAEHHDNSAPLNAIPQPAIPWLAAGMPHQAGATLALYLLSLRDFLPRPGYVLTAIGRSAFPADPAEPLPTASQPASSIPAPSPAAAAASNTAPWQVNLMHCGIVIESYWFSDDRRLLCIQTQGVQTLISRRVDSAKTAATPMERIPPKTKPSPAPIP